MENKEEWRAIKGYEGLYEVSNTGRVRTIKKGNPYVLKMYDKFGYKDVILWKNNKMKNKRVHRLVAEAFIPNPNLYPIINHKDENRSNNNVENLEWCTYKYNSNYKNSRKRCSKNSGNNRKVLQIDFDGNIISEYYNMSEASRISGVNQSLISQCCRMEKTRGGGFLWCFSENKNDICKLVKNRLGRYFRLRDGSYITVKQLSRAINVNESTIWSNVYRNNIDKFINKYYETMS